MSAPTRPRPPMDTRIAERRAQVADRRRRRRRRVLVSVVALVVLAAGAAGALASPLFAIERVDVVGAPSSRADEVREAVGIVPGDNLVMADIAGGAEAVAGLPWVADAQVDRAPPAEVVVTVQRRRPAAVVRLEGAAWTVDGDAVVLSGGVAEEDALEIDAPNSVLPGPGVAASDSAVNNALAFHDGLPPDMAERVDRYEAPSERGLRLRIEGPDGARVWVRVGTAEDVEAKAEVIEALLAQAAERSGDAPVRELDVRAPSNPVLVPGDASG